MVPKPPAPLVGYLQSGRCALFVGSGLSAAAKLPTWKDLLKEMIDEIGGGDTSKPVVQELTKMLNEGKLLEVAFQCRDELTIPGYSALLTRKLRPDDLKIPEQHKIITQLPFAAVVTTNYDKLLEMAYQEDKKGPKVFTQKMKGTQGTALFDGGFFILKAHGDIDDPESLILTSRDYSENINANQAFNSFFSALLLTKAILFVGYSLNDPDFRLLLDKQLTIFSDYIPPRYALMSGIGAVEISILKRTAGIQVLSYDEGKHEQVLTFFQSLKEAVAPTPEPVVLERAVTREMLTTPEPAAAQPSGALVPQTITVAVTELSIKLSGAGQVAATLSRDGRDLAMSLGTLPSWSEIVNLFQTNIFGSDVVGLFYSEEGPRKIGKMLSQCLPKEILNALASVSQDQVIALHLSPELEVLPWEWTLIGGKPLFILHPVVRAPITVSDKARGYPAIQEKVRALLIGDTMASAELPGARAEIVEIASLYQVRGDDFYCKMLLGAEATFNAVVSEIQNGDYDVIHFAGHAWFDAQDSYLILNEDATLRANELRSYLSQRPPAVMVFNSHFTSFVPPGIDRDKLDQSSVPGAEQAPVLSVTGQRGFTETALAAGVGAFVGCFASPTDDMGKDIGVKFHQELLEGRPVAFAFYNTLISEQQKSRKKTEKVDASWMQYVISGYCDLAFPIRAKEPAARSVSTASQKSVRRGLAPRSKPKPAGKSAKSSRAASKRKRS
ncbi:MAG: SIR2 family protein [Pyrinomonadaceae bacterium]